MLENAIIPVHPVLTSIQAMLAKVDRLRLPVLSRRDIQSILTRQVAEELDYALPWQQGHGFRTAILAVALGRSAGVSPDELHHLKLASLLHDIGLLALPSSLVINPGRWESDAYAAVQCHPRIGAGLLEPFQFLREASVIIAHHHERWDGSGYPYGIRGLFIPLGARILSIADAFDAIDVPNVKSADVRAKVAWRIVRAAAGTQFDPFLVRLAERCFTETTPQSLETFHMSSRRIRASQQGD